VNGFPAMLSLGQSALAVVAFLAAAAIGFLLGVRYAKSAAARAFERAKSSLENLYAHTVRSIESAQEACTLLSGFPDLQLSLEQLQRLDDQRGRLTQAMQQIVNAQPTGPAEEDPEDFVFPEIAWVRSPEHTVSKLPDRSAFDANCRLVLTATADVGIHSGLLLVRMDKAEHLKVRFGIAGVQQFTRKMAALICRSIRDEDFVCQFSAETFAVLMPGVTESAARAAAETVRKTIRRHNFRLSDDGPEVLVTASFGATVFNGADGIETILNRATSALNRSAKQGRNKLHLDNGSEVVACSGSVVS